MIQKTISASWNLPILIPRFNALNALRLAKIALIFRCKITDSNTQNSRHEQQPTFHLFWHDRHLQSSLLSNFVRPMRFGYSLVLNLKTKVPKLPGYSESLDSNNVYWLLNFLLALVYIRLLHHQYLCPTASVYYCTQVTTGKGILNIGFVTFALLNCVPLLLYAPDSFRMFEITLDVSLYK